MVLEIDITSSSLDKFVIYRALGVPEIWPYNGKLLRVSLWNAENKVYERSDYSRVFSWLKVDDLSAFIQQCLIDGETKTLRDFRRWLQSQAHSSI